MSSCCCRRRRPNIIAARGARRAALELFACTVQQKGFGALLGRNVAVRQMVGVNSDMIRTMKLVLGTPGVSVAKVRYARTLTHSLHSLHPPIHPPTHPSREEGTRLGLL